MMQNKNFKKPDLCLVPNGPSYYEFIRKLRIDPAIVNGFISTSPITKEQQIQYMENHEKDYFICLYLGKPVGFIGVVDDDLRLAVEKEYQRKGIASFMLSEINKIIPDFSVKVKKTNKPSLAFFKKFGYYETRDVGDCFVMKKKIPFNIPHMTGKEIQYILEAVDSGKLSGNGAFTKKCQTYFEARFGFKKCLLTTSCTDALEMAALLAKIQPGDEVILPSYTFVSTALAFVRQGAKMVFVDSYKNQPNLNPETIEPLITSKTKAIVPVHYAGIACDMDEIMSLAEKYQLLVIEDAAQAINSFYKGRPLGSIGHFGCFSFHETKNVISGEGGMLAINDESYSKRSEIIWEKGTNRAEFFRGEVNKYGWVDVGSSFLPSEITAAFLYAQLESLDIIQNRRKSIWDNYYKTLLPYAQKGYFSLPIIPDYATNNAHIFYLICNSSDERKNLINTLKKEGILAVFHYLCLHNSEYYQNKHDGRNLPNCEKFSDCLVRLPLYYEMTELNVERVCNIIKEFYENKASIQ